MYTSIQDSFWTDEKNDRLSSGSKLFFLYLLSCPHRNIIGFYQLPLKYAAVDVGKSQKKVQKYLAELENNGQIKYDPETSCVLIFNFLKYNPLQNPNQFVSACNKLKELPVTPLLDEFFTIVDGLTYEKGTGAKGFLNGCETVGEGLRKGCEIKKPEIRNQKSEKNVVVEAPARQYITFYNSNISHISPHTVEDAENLISQGIPDELIVLALKEAVENNVKNWAYAKKILHTWQEKGVSSLDQAIAVQAEFKRRRMQVVKGKSTSFEYNQYTQEELDQQKREALEILEMCGSC